MASKKPSVFGTLDKKDKEELSIRPSPRIKKRLGEIAAVEAKRRKRKRIGLGNLISASVEHYISEYNEGRVDKKHSRNSTEDSEESAFDLGSDNYLDAIQSFIPSDQIEMLDKIAEKQDRKRSDVVRSAIDMMIGYFDEHGHL